MKNKLNPESLFREEETVEELTAHAMIAAKDAFYNYIEQDGTESAYWSIRIEATHRSLNWKPMLTMTFDDNAQFSCSGKEEVSGK